MDRHNSNSLIVIVGPTAIGKTGIAIQLARQIQCEIISCDSRQFFAEMNIGTAKPSQDEMEGIPHHFINNLSIHDYYSAGRFESDVLDFLNAYYKRHNRILMVGGSGLYVKAVCESISQMPKPDNDIREMVKKEYDSGHLDSLLSELEEKDPEYFKIVDINNPKRIIRAIEVIRQSGLKYSTLRSPNHQKRAFNILKIGLEMERKSLYERINVRMDNMIELGLFDEARQLYTLKELNALQTVGYKEIFDHFDGQYDREETIRLLKRNSRRYAKRQLTWFKKDPDVHWFQPDDYTQILNTIKEFLGNVSR